jgi:hypothetical protein
MLNKGLLKTSQAVLLPLGVSLLLFASFLLVPALKYIVLYLLILLILAALWRPEKIVFWQRVEIKR